MYFFLWHSRGDGVKIQRVQLVARGSPTGSLNMRDLVAETPSRRACSYTYGGSARNKKKSRGKRNVERREGAARVFDGERVNETTGEAWREK